MKSWVSRRREIRASSNFFDFKNRVVGERLFVVCQVKEALHWRPLAGICTKAVPPVIECLGGNGRGNPVAGILPVCHEILGAVEAQVIRKFGLAQMSKQVARRRGTALSGSSSASQTSLFRSLPCRKASGEVAGSKTARVHAGDCRDQTAEPGPYER